MGMGLPKIQVDAYICYLFGSLVPFVLRQDGKFWNLVADAYVYGFYDVSRAL